MPEPSKSILRTLGRTIGGTDTCPSGRAAAGLMLPMSHVNATISSIFQNDGEMVSLMRPTFGLVGLLMVKLRLNR